MKHPICIHAGYAKAGSTYLQRAVFPFAENAVLLWKQPGYAKILESFKQAPKTFNPKTVHAWIEQTVQPAPGQTLLLSHENLSGYSEGGKPQEAFNVAQNLHACFPHATLLFILRAQQRSIASTYTYRTSGRGLETRSFNTYVKCKLTSGTWERLQYHYLLQTHAELFSKQALCVLPVEHLKRNRPDFIHTIATHFNVTFNAQGMEAAQHVRHNDSVRHPALLNIFRASNAIYKHIDWLMHRVGLPNKICLSTYLKYCALKLNIAHKCNKYLGLKCSIQLNTENLQNIEKAYAASNAQTQTFTHINLQKLGYPAPENLKI